MVKLNRGSSRLDVSGVQPYPIAWSEDWCWGTSAVASLSLDGLGAAHLGPQVVVDLLNGGSSGEGVGVPRYGLSSWQQAGCGPWVVAMDGEERGQVGGLG